MMSGEKKWKITFIVRFELFLQLLHFHVTLLFLLPTLQSERTEIRLVFHFILSVFTNQRVLVMISYS